MKKRLMILSMTLLAAVALTACAAGQPAGSSPAAASVASVSTPAPTGTPTPAPTATPSPTSAPQEDPMMLSRTVCQPDPLASMEGGVTLPASWTEKRYTAAGLLAEEWSGPLEEAADSCIRYAYDDQDYLVEEVHSSLQDGSWQVVQTTTYESDQFGNPLTETNLLAEGSLPDKSYSYLYDEEGRWVRQDLNDPSFPTWKIREYTGEGLACTESLYYPGDVLRMVSAYDAEGRLLREEDRDGETVIGYRQYTYDEQGGLICVRVDYVSDELGPMNQFTYTNTYTPLTCLLVDAQTPNP